MLAGEPAPGSHTGQVPWDASWTQEQAALRDILPLSSTIGKRPHALKKGSRPMAHTILVTGSNSGFGGLTVDTLAHQGYNVFAGMRDVAGWNARTAGLPPAPGRAITVGPAGRLCPSPA